MFRIFCAFFAFSMFLNLDSNAQAISSFPQEKDKFLDAVEKYLKDTKREDCEKAGADFVKAAEGGVFSEEVFGKVQETINSMMRRS